ncbi:myosin-6 [Halyomorpha halys]|uniref:myosin-6 n=1 Tax=Halyomorpha halys TaxID=286706 RepID=UPI0006D4D039|nr:myosin heavy chain, embryonic smooth muscle isoform-like [Halyomorpha halys]
MADQTLEFKTIYDIPDLSFLENKMREKIYELERKRKLVDECRTTITKLDADKHVQAQRAEKVERELAEVNIHLEVAIKAAREAEAERSSAKERLARQGAQLEAASKERDLLQQLNRNQQLDIINLQRQLEESKSKMKSQSYIMDAIQKKDVQIRSTLETLKCEVIKLENSQGKLKEICTKITNISKAVLTLWNQRNTELLYLRTEKSDLENTVISLKVKMRTLMEENSQRLEKEPTNNVHILEWEAAQQEMRNRIEDNNNEISHLQSSLDSALATVAKYQAVDIENSKIIRRLEEKLKKSAFDEMENKSVQTEDTKQNEKLNARLPPISCSEIQSSEVDTQEGGVTSSLNKQTRNPQINTSVF